MFTLALCLSFLSIYNLYAQSGKIEPEKKGIMLWLKKQKNYTLFLAAVTFLLSTLILHRQLGPAVGILTSLMLWTVLASFMILFIPFEKLSWPHLLIGLVLLSLVEMSVPLI